MHQSTLRLQAATAATANRHGDTITIADLNLVEAFLDEPIAEVARALGRTYFATQTMRQLVREGVAAAPTRRVAASDRPYRGWVEGMGDV